VILEDNLARQSRDNFKITAVNLRNVLYQIIQENFSKLWFYNFWAQFGSFDVSDSCHVIVEHYSARRSRDNFQNNCHKPQKHVLFRKLY